jgi:hypothetical protein
LSNGFNRYAIIILAVNSAPLSLCKIFGAPKRRKISKIGIATSVALFDFNGRRTTNFVIEDMFNVVQKIHIATGHGGRDKMIMEANKKYANVKIGQLE